ncbi:uncharacterized protein LOC129751020 [Uranotaenia lowii]|uniref:uncharacterized protein LOC129751020 n=1 Tax=Uranotaenia lowii TaxID=190385 RepID=UPI002478D086|nr:uncharacterized protein LOC129751020 [Uranotaenia lowii]
MRLRMYRCSNLYFYVAFGLILSAKWIFAQNMLTNRLIMNGFIFPSTVTVAVGEIVHLKILVTMNENDRCFYRMPGSADDIDVHDAGNTFRISRATNQTRSRLQQTEEQQSGVPRNGNDNECGINIHNVNRDDAGFWRLTLIRESTLIRGVSMVNVIDVPTIPDTSDRDSITELDEITPEGTDYCYMLRDSGSQNRDVPMYETCMLQASGLDPTGNGHWNVIAGVQGHMREINFAINIEQKDEQILTSVNHGPDYQVLMCNLRYSQLRMKFCRFLRLADNLGFNMLEGVGWDRYRYYGDGFGTGNCGLEIEEPDTVDRGLWKCVIGYGDESIMKVSGAILDSSETDQELAIIEAGDVNALKGTEMTLRCNANKPLDYCWFRDPEGMIYSVSEHLEQDDDLKYWYSGVALSMGDCGMRVRVISEEVAGQWSCHVGSSAHSALEVSRTIQVRVSESQIIGSTDRVETSLDTALSIECSSIPANTPLQYCRFVSPSGDAFSLNEGITSDNAILGNYYSNPAHDPKKGFCSVIIRNVRTADIGLWICAGKIAGHTMEHYSVIEVALPQISTELTTASIIGMAIGGAALLLIGLSLGYYNFRRRMKNEVSAVNREIEMSERAAEHSRYSIASRTSDSSHDSRNSDIQLRATAN